MMGGGVLLRQVNPEAENKICNKSMVNNRSDEDDRRLMQSFFNGDNGAFSFVYNKYASELFVYGTGLGFEREILKDAIQDVFVKMYMSKTQLKGVVYLK
jgi:hypothetical protein